MICVYLEVQCCGSGSGRIRSFLLDPDPVRKVGSGSGSGQKLIGSATLLKTIAISMGGVLNRRCFVMLVFQALAFYVRTKYWCCNKDYHISYPE